MLEFLKDWVLNIAVIAVLLVFIELLIPSGKTKKFVNLISGFILIITIIQPFLKFLLKGYDLNWLNAIDNSFSVITEVDVTNTEFREEQIKQIVKVYRKRLIEQIIEIAKGVEEVRDAEADVILNEDYNSQRFGEIKRVYVNIVIDNENRQGDLDPIIAPVRKIDEVKINIGQIEQKDTSRERDIEDKLKNKIVETLEDRISRSLMIKREDIVISFK
ncbi:MAG: stage III sporulation protein AF [Firmicutes bacterium]|nr:stage III sporulation protein AF [Bacillota bacterium]